MPELLRIAGESLSFSGEGELKRISMLAYSGGIMRLPGVPHPVVVELSGLDLTDKSRPILKDHRSHLVLGHTERIEIRDGAVHATAVLSGTGPVAKEFAETATNGFPWQASITVRMLTPPVFIPKGKTLQANGRTFNGPVYVVRKSTLLEISAVALGADDETQTRLAAAAFTEKSTMTFEEFIKAQGLDPANISETLCETLKASFDAEGEGDGGDGDTGTVTVAERKRIASIETICAGAFPQIESQAISEDWTPDRTRLEVMRAKRPSIQATRAQRGLDRRQVLTASLCLSGGLTTDQIKDGFDERVIDSAVSRENRNAGIHTVMHEVIRAAGRHWTPGVVNDDFIAEAFEADRILRASGGSHFSSISLPGILGDFMHRGLLAAYNGQASVVHHFAKEAEVKDFRRHKRYRLTSTGTLQRVPESGELKHTTLGEQDYGIEVDTWGEMLTVTRKMLINDDLQALSDIPSMFGRKAMLLREELAFTRLLALPGEGFFATGNKNYQQGADTALSIESLTAAEQLFLDQVGPDGKPILTTPKTLLVPTALKVTAQSLMRETRVVGPTSGKNLADNPHAGKWEPVASPYMNNAAIAGGSAKHWLLCADPNDVPFLEIAYLRGHRTPTIERGELNFDRLGIGWRCFWDIGVEEQDHRGAVYSLGEAE